MESLSLSYPLIGELDHLHGVHVCRDEDVLDESTIATVTREMTSIFHEELRKTKQAMSGRHIEIVISGKYGHIRIAESFKLIDGKALVGLLHYTVE